MIAKLLLFLKIVTTPNPSVNGSAILESHISKDIHDFVLLLV